MLAILPWEIAVRAIRGCAGCIPNGWKHMLSIARVPVMHSLMHAGINNVINEDAATHEPGCLCQVEGTRLESRRLYGLSPTRTVSRRERGTDC
jgi:hypothetical protein